MPRGGEIVVREATDDDRHVLATLWVTLASQAHEPSPDKSGSPPRVFVAEISGEVVGMVAMGRDPVTPVAGVKALEITELHVRGGYEHRRVGSELIAAATTEADRLGCEHVLMTVSHSGRAHGRLLPRRMGLGSARRRLTPVATLRRRLGLDVVAGESLVARRRAVLRRTPSLPPTLQQEVRRS